MKAIGIILAGGNSKRVGRLSDKRAIAALPIAGSYRAIDFALSNMTNSKVNKVAVFPQFNARSLNEHLSSSKWWDFGRKQGGLYVFTPTVTKDNNSWYLGTADALYQNMDYLKKSHEPYVIIAAGDGVYKLDYGKVLERHIEKNADITVVYTKMSDKDDDLTRFGILKLDENERIVDFEEKPLVAETNNVSIGVYIIRRRHLIEILERCAKEDRHDFVKDVLVRYKNVRKIYGYLMLGCFSIYMRDCLTKYIVDQFRIHLKMHRTIIDSGNGQKIFCKVYKPHRVIINRAIYLLFFAFI